MEVRCPGCNKLFRVSDDKIQGSGVKFACTRCGNSVKISRDDFERYLSSQKAAAAPVFESPAPQKQAAPMPPKLPELDLFDLSGPDEAAAAMQDREEEMLLFAEPAPDKPSRSPADQAPKPEIKPEIKAEIKPNIKTEIKTEQRPAEIRPRSAQKPKPEAGVAAKPENEPAPALAPYTAAPSAPAGEVRPAASVINIDPPQSPVSSGIGRKTAILLVVAIIVIGSAAGMKYYHARSSRQVQDAVQQLISPEGLRIRNASGTVDPVKQDLIINGIVENMNDKPKMGWYVLAEIYDAQGTVLIRSKLVNGKQFYTSRDYEILAGRGENIQDIRARQLQEPGISIPAGASVNFEIRIMQPPAGIASFNATLQPFDPVQMFREMAEGQK